MIGHNQAQWFIGSKDGIVFTEYKTDYVEKQHFENYLVTEKWILTTKEGFTIRLSTEASEGDIEVRTQEMSSDDYKKISRISQLKLLQTNAGFKVVKGTSSSFSSDYY